LLYTNLLPRGSVKWFLASDRRLGCFPDSPWIAQQVINDVWAQLRHGATHPLIAIHYKRHQLSAVHAPTRFLRPAKRAADEHRRSSGATP
jgi:hypothetical protein